MHIAYIRCFEVKPPPNSPYILLLESKFSMIRHTENIIIKLHLIYSLTVLKHHFARLNSIQKKIVLVYLESGRKNANINTFTQQMVMATIIQLE